MKQFRKPDLNAPRYRVKKTQVIDEEYMKQFKARYPEFSHYGLRELKKIIHKFNGLLWEKVLQTRDGIELPEGLGFVFIGSCGNVTRDNIDYGKSIKHGFVVKHKNWDTDGYVGKIFFSAYYAKYKLKERAIWAFTASRDFKRAVKESYKENWKTYLVVENTTDVVKMYRKQRSKDYFKVKNVLDKKDYNDFEMD
ncbi:hypothetical protein EB118_05855 [bacterium]|nr:hypothetical protein [bacterium]NDD82904.1 hypothetical protein [bacterium]NDG29606.1 hypothetical protein [bacterium]